MSIGEKFTALLEARGVKQAFVAAQYRERALARGSVFAQDTVESHISRLKKGDAVAVRFFFADPSSARDLFDILDVTEARRAEYLRDANAMLTPEERPLRVVVDLSDGPQGRELVSLCEDLAINVVSQIHGRIALVVTEPQRLYLLPACTPERHVVVEAVVDAKAGWDRTTKLAADGAFVLSGRRFDPWSRWIAFEVRDGRMAFEPYDGVRRCAEGKALDDVDADATSRPLDQVATCVAAAAPPNELAGTPTALRALLAKLTSGMPVYARVYDHYGRGDGVVDAKTRLAWGEWLGVSVAATPEEWATHLLARAKAHGVAMSSKGTLNDLASHRARVARGGSAPRAIIVGGELHLINAPTGMRTEMQGLHGVRFHDEVRRASGFQRITELVQTTPWEAWLDDPYMDAALARIDPEGRDRDELEFARASLLLCGKLHAAEAPNHREWRAMLREILKSDPPAVGVRVPTERKLDSGATVTLLPDDELRRREARPGVELHGVPALVPPRVTRENTLSMLERASQNVDELRYASSQAEHWLEKRRFLLPPAHVLTNVDWLFTLFDNTPAKVGCAQRNVEWWYEKRNHHLLGLEWKKATVPTHERFWADADRMLAVLWVALRRALKHADGITLHDNTGVLEMGGGLVAMVKASAVRTGGSDLAVADFWRWPRLEVRYGEGEEAHPTVSVVREIGTRVARTGSYCTRIMAEVPTRVLLAKGAVRVSVTFEATPWETFGERAATSELVAGVGGVLHAEDDAERAAQDDE